MPEKAVPEGGKIIDGKAGESNGQHNRSTARRARGPQINIDEAFKQQNMERQVVPMGVFKSYTDQQAWI